MLVLCLAAVFAISTSVAQQSGSYRLTDNSNIEAGVLAPATGLEACMVYCTSRADCQSFDFDPSPTSNACWWHTTQSGLQTKTGIQHFDKTCQQAPPAPPPVLKACPPGFNYSVNGLAKCYYVNDQPLNWHEAAAKCKGLHSNARLTVINSALEDQVISTILEKHECPSGEINGWFWIGGRRTSDSCSSPIQWRPTNRAYQPLGYTNYCPGEPNCHISNPQYCLAAVNDCRDRRNTYGWHDGVCSSKLCAICEILKFD